MRGAAVGVDVFFGFLTGAAIEGGAVVSSYCIVEGIEVETIVGFKDERSVGLSVIGAKLGSSLSAMEGVLLGLSEAVGCIALMLDNER